MFRRSLSLRYLQNIDASLVIFAREHIIVSSTPRDHPFMNIYLHNQWLMSSGSMRGKEKRVVARVVMPHQAPAENKVELGFNYFKTGSFEVRAGQ
uniref:Uncharacterized protein n=1 Tax=Caenorhabditis japonica TaxID=281687 RepID=A0A8R1INZ6_CAEJA